MDIVKIRERYLRDSIPLRLGGLAANLLRIQSFARQDKSRNAVDSLIEESKWFIEWTAAETDEDTAAELVEIQIDLACWQLQWNQIWTDKLRRMQIAEQSRVWSDRVLDLSGLMNS